MAIGKFYIFYVVFIFTVLQCYADEDAPAVYTPKKFCVRLTTNTTALIQWVEPMAFRLEVIGYNVYYTRDARLPLVEWNSTTIGNYPSLIIRKIELGEVYTFRVQVNTLGLEGPGPISETYQFQMLNRTRSCYDQPKTTIIKSLNVIRAAATSLNSVEVWWNLYYDIYHVNGFQIFYGLMSDLAEVENKTVGLVQSIELRDLEEGATYRIGIAAITNAGLEYYPQETVVTVIPEYIPSSLEIEDIYESSFTMNWVPPIRFYPVKYKISYDAVKDFVDSGGIRQHFHYDVVEKIVDGTLKSYTFTHLIPYTTYNINISAIPIDYSYRPAAKISAKTEMAAPLAMLKPNIYGIINDNSGIQFLLPKASEEYGPIDYYYVIVIPKGETDLTSNAYATDELLDTRFEESEEVDEPYIAAKFMSKIPYAFILGTGGANGFTNYRLNSHREYKIFVRAVVVTPRGEMHTDSPYSDYVSLDMAKDNLKRKN